MLSPRSFKRRPEGLADEARRWISSGETYTARFGIGVLMKFYLDEGFEPEMPGWAAAACRGDYYVDMGAGLVLRDGHSQAARGRHRHAHRAPPERLGAQQDHTKGAGVLPRQRGDEGPSQDAEDKIALPPHGPILYAGLRGSGRQSIRNGVII